MSSIPSISGVYTNTYLKKVYYGPACTKDALPEAVKLLSKTQKAFIITGQSLASKTDVVTKVEKALGSAHAGTSANIGQHAPVENIREALAVMRSKNADVIVGEYIRHDVSISDCSILSQPSEVALLSMQPRLSPFFPMTKMRKPRTTTMNVLFFLL